MACLISCAFTVLTFLLDPSRLPYPERPVVYLAFCYAVVAVVFLVGFFHGEDIACNPEVENRTMNFLSERTIRQVGWDNLVIGSFFFFSFCPQFIFRGSSGGVFQRDLMHFPLPPCRPQFNLDHGLPPPSSLPRVQGNIVQNPLCTLTAMALYFFLMAGSLWWVMLTVAWFLSAGLKWGQEAIDAKSQYFHITAWVLPSLQTAAAIILKKVEGERLPFLSFSTQPILMPLEPHQQL